MGCDIHMVAEVKSKTRGAVMIMGGQRTDLPPKDFWYKVGPFFLSQYYDPTDKSIQYSQWDQCTSPLTVEPWGRRNYLLFAKLAGVRNYWNIKPLSEPKGLPVDVSDDTIEYLNGAADHSHSWLTLEELKKFDWDTPFEVKDETKSQWVCLSRFGAVVDQLSRIAYGLKIEDTDIRIVFGFDN